jgi:hypothetical protein
VVGLDGFLLDLQEEDGCSCEFLARFAVEKALQDLKEVVESNQIAAPLEG